MADPCPKYEQELPYSNIPCLNLKITAVSLLLISIILLIFSAHLFYRYISQTKKQEPLLYLGLCYTCLGVGLVITQIPQWLRFLDPENSLIYGFPLLFDNKMWYTNITYCLIVTSNMFMLVFVRLVFRTISKRLLYSIIGMNAIWVLYNIWLGLNFYSTDDLGNVELRAAAIPVWMMIIFIIFTVASYAWLAVSAYNLTKKQHPSVERFGVKLIFWAGVVSILSYVTHVIIQIGRLYLDFIPYTIALLGFFSVYLGFTMPKWLQSRIKTRYEG